MLKKLTVDDVNKVIKKYFNTVDNWCDKCWRI